MTFDPEVWGTVSDWIVAATAVGAVWFGRQQLIRVVEESARQADVARADLMLKIDQMFEGELLASRKAIQTLRNLCEAEALALDNAAEEVEHKQQTARIFSDFVTKLYGAYKVKPTVSQSGAIVTATEKAKRQKAESAHVEAGTRYLELMALPYWMETVGMLAHKNLLRRDDVLDLYDAAFIGVLDCFEAHIQYRRNERLDRDDRFLEYAIWFRDKAKLRVECMARNPTARRRLS